MLSVELSRESVRQSPPYDPVMPWDRDMDRVLYRHYGRGGYWSEAGDAGVGFGTHIRQSGASALPSDQKDHP